MKKQTDGLRRARAEHAGAARGRRQPRRARGADGRRPSRLRHADRRRGGVPRTGVGGRRRLRHRLRQRGDPDRSLAARHAGSRRPPRRARRRDPGRDLVRHRPQEPIGRCAGRIIRCSSRASWDALPRHARERSSQQGARAARHGRQRQSLRRRLRRRSGRDLGRRALRQPRVRSHRRLRVPRALAGREVGRARARARGAARRSISRWATTTGR